MASDKPTLCTDNHSSKSLDMRSVGAAVLGTWNYYRNSYFYNKTNDLLLYIKCVQSRNCGLQCLNRQALWVVLWHKQ